MDRLVNCVHNLAGFRIGLLGGVSLGNGKLVRGSPRSRETHLTSEERG